MSAVEVSRTDLTDDLPLYPGLDLDRITLVEGGAALAAAGGALRAAEVIGFDSESKPTFRKGEESTGPHLIQLATDDHAWLFQVANAEVHPLLREILESPTLLKVGFGLGNDRSALKRRLDIVPRNLLDLGEKLRGPGHRGTVGAKVAVAHFFGQRFQKSKKTGTSNWATRRLDERQLRYAANDAHVALRLYQAWRAAHPDA
ncbi:3'-5' exonuclease [Azonexus hydrophilus]|uniref:3'-5' exonuclease n=1 Tax=Azonexus hydrophilus TaxID=418702 RepID=A0ABZ2XK28_9RHOO|nr:3'-5' exonuclease [Azonexus hydrophilus]